MSGSESLCNQSSEPPSQYRGTSDSQQWIQGSNTNNNVPATVGTPLQWSELPLPQHIVPGSRNGPVFNHQKQNNGVNNLNSFNSRNHMEATFIEPVNGFCVPNASRALIGHIPSTANVFYPVVQNGTSLNGWNNAMANGNRFATRSSWSNASTNKTGGVRKPKRIRTAFNSQQMMELEQEYARSRYLDRTRRIELAEILRLNERTIKIWFQNRRMKEKKDRAESFEESEATSTTDSSSEIGMPIIIQDQIPAGNDEFNRESFVEYYPVTPAPNSMPSTSLPVAMPQDIQSPALNGYSAYIQENQYEAQCRQVHLQMQHYPSPPPYNGSMQEIIEAPSMQPEPAAVPTSNNVIEPSWDLSWIRSIHITED